MTWANRLALVILAPCVALLGCRDYLYAHTIRGQVIAPNGTDFTALEVCRVTEAGIRDDLDVELDGVRQHRCRGLDEHGAFEFHQTGLGPKPDPSQTWHLVVVRGSEALGALTVEAEWSSGSEPLGYFAEVEIEIDGEAN